MDERGMAEKLYFYLNECFFVNSLVQYRSLGVEFNICISTLQLQDDLVWYYCYKSPARRKKKKSTEGNP